MFQFGCIRTVKTTTSQERHFGSFESDEKFTNLLLVVK